MSEEKKIAAMNSAQTAFDIALDALAEYQNNWDTGLPFEYAQTERIAMECAVEAVREALYEARNMHATEAEQAPTPDNSGLYEMAKWAVERWNAEVKNRPLANVHRRTLDDVWRQVIRHCGADPDVLVGMSHDDLLAASRPASGETE